MTRRAAAGLALLLAVLAAGVLWTLTQQDGTPHLTVHLRCPDAVAGRLSIVLVAAGGQAQGEQVVELAPACVAGRVRIERYRDDQRLQFRLVRADGQSGELVARYGPDIQRDQDGFYTVLRITAVPPFLAHDRI